MAAGGDCRTAELGGSAALSELQACSCRDDVQSTISDYFGFDMFQNVCDGPNSIYGFGPGVPNIGSRLQPILGVTATERTEMIAAGCTNVPSAPIVGTIGARTNNSASPGPGELMPFENSSVAIFGTQTQSLGNLFNGNEASARTRL